MKIAVFCASANNIDPLYKKEGQILGELIAENNWTLVYGGVDSGLMQEVAEGVISKGGKTIGILPKFIDAKGVRAKNATDIIVTENMSSRKTLLRQNADAFVVLPGGWGTIEEFSEVITLKQLSRHNKPIVFVNTNNFFTPLFDFITKIREMNFISDKYDNLYEIVNSSKYAINYIKNYKISTIEAKY